MTPLTEDDLGAVLRDAFAAHETLADPDRAVSLAGAPRRRTHPVGAVLAGVTAVAAAVAISFTVQSWPADEENGSRFLEGVTTTTSTPADEAAAKAAQDAANKAETTQLAEDLVDNAPTLPGATRHESSPTNQLAEGNYFIGGYDNNLSRTGWWSAPGSMDEALAWFLANPPVGMKSEDGGKSLGPDGTMIPSVIYTGSETAAYLTPSLLLQVTALGDGVAVRADSFVSWRPARLDSSYVDGVTSIRITGLSDARGTFAVGIEVAEVIDRLVAQYNSQPGIPSWAAGCPPTAMEVPHRKITFHMDTGDLVAEESRGCGSAMVVHRNGELLQPELAETEELRDYFDSIVHGGLAHR